ncbi:hypothetical protein C5B42_03625 [Candidatus Cerribacteria bacterium 'Amazon FNV 2010 28 9']|uniref:Penicillin-binding protein 2 n=1 Tax=Candidatus Cerribacteria bacterium 'Amazon FNV 2010 28 9' TaxID=2081795 RepID=A0A317JNU1_9BACT|nr:MAG: hypothetical protein C5B42_03625 [Candidatus Cerribacteria bacterium 'Amazon FNV 2010 28 9']
MKRLFFHSSSSQTHIQRMGWISCICVGIAVLLIVRCVDLMIFQGETLREMADNNRFFTQTILPNRGIITDRFGNILVANIPVYREAVQTVPVIHPTLIATDSAHAFDLLLHDPQRLYQTQSRVPQFSNTLSHVIGYTGVVDPNTTSDVASLSEIVGKTGVEREFNDRLTGVAGDRTYEMSANGKIIRTVDETPPISGQDLTLSLDATLSATAFNALNGRPGTVIATDIATSQVLAMVSSPSFSKDTLVDSLHDPLTPLINRSLHPYPPGSVFKMMVALAGLEEGTITKDSLILDDGQVKVGDAVFRNWFLRDFGRTEGNITVVRALTSSNDVFFYKLAGQVGPDAIAHMASLFHFGETTGFELHEEETGLIPTPAWKESTIGEKWYLGDTYHMGIGQGDVLVTPLQINAMTAALARDGTWCIPTLLTQHAPICEEIPVHKENVEIVNDGMVGACTAGGTGVPFFQWNSTASDSAKVACKTGTAEHGSADAQGRRKTHAWFTMFYPRVNPKIAITVLLESTSDQPFLEGSADAAPIAKAVWDNWRARYPQ